MSARETRVDEMWKHECGCILWLNYTYGEDYERLVWQANNVGRVFQCPKCGAPLPAAHMDLGSSDWQRLGR